MTPRETILDLKARMGRSIIGQEQIIERLLIGLLANGHCWSRDCPASPRRAP
jgi:MoxR-like ATPase